ncbi:MAG: MBL fold metallo-hydrolase [Labilithrix sp.]|nr:MBL fold metallo-hydrolase [Labilithrix sp.]MCW5809961.1 MBL fold metallo-hydrolase [Labilithrix sp.]
MSKIALLALLSALAATACVEESSAPVEAEAPVEAPVATPVEAPMPVVSLCWVETAHTNVLGSATASGIVVRHAKGTVLVDAGASTSYDAEIEPYSGKDRAFYEAIPAMMKPRAPLPAVLAGMGIRADEITSFLPTHVHVDHVGGMMDMPDVPVLLTPPEAELVRRGLDETLFEIVPAHARRLAPLVKEIELTDQPHEGFARSFDPFGDGTIVVVPLPGHTPGSVGVFLDLHDGHPIFHVGDTVSTLAQLEAGEPKGFLMADTDSDPDATLERVGDLRALAARAPNVRILPAHDRRAWQAIFGSPGSCIEAR